MQLIILSVERNDLTENRFTAISASAVFCDYARPNFNLLTESQDARQYRATRYATFQFVYFCTGFVDVEGADDNEPWVGGEIADGDRDSFDDVLVDSVNIILQLGRDRNDGGRFSDSSCK